MSRPYKQTLSFIRVVNARWSAETAEKGTITTML